MRPTAIHQFNELAAPGDAVTNSMLLTRRLFRTLGARSDIYVGKRAPELSEEVSQYTDYVPSPQQLLFVHHAFGHEFVPWVLGLPDRKVLVYHNITPAHFFSIGTPRHRDAELGRRQLLEYKDQVVGAIAVSQYNAEELVALSYVTPSVVPLVFDLESTTSGHSSQVIIEHNVGIKTILSVGRITPHKCQHDVIQAYARFRRIAEQPSQLVLIGSCVDGAYRQYLQHLVLTYGLTEQVKLLGHVSAEDLRAWYRVAAVLVSMSEHEGFCVPLLEAMSWDVPVAAYASSNIPATLAGAGVLFRTKEYDEIASVLKRLVEDEQVRRSIIVRQRRRVRDFWPSKLRAELSAALAMMGIDVGSRVPASYSTRAHLTLQGNLYEHAL